MPLARSLQRRAFIVLAAALATCVQVVRHEGVAWASQADSAALPLQPAREARFETREGTWMSVDVAPDGRRFAFDLLGDIYLLPSTGGRAQLLIGGMDYAVQPRFSPDGTQIVFVSDRSGADNVWIVDASGGNPRQLTRTLPGEQLFFGGPEWTPDGASILVWTTRRRNWEYGNLPREIRRYSIASGAFDVIAGEAGHEIAGAEFPTLSPDARYLYLALKRAEPTTFDGERMLPIWQLARRDLHSGAFSALTSGHGGGFAPALSPDGRYIVYGSRDGRDTGLRLLDLLTGRDTWLAFPIDRDQQESNYSYNLPGMSFTPDSRFVVAAFAGRIWRIEIADGRAEPVPFVAEVRQSLGPLAAARFRVEDREVRTRDVRTPTPSPDGRFIAFTALHRLWVMPVAGGAPYRVVDRESYQYHPAWSEDGRTIVYADWHDSEGGHLYRVRVGNARASKPVRLTTHAANYLSPVIVKGGANVHAIRIGGHPDASRPPYDHVVMPIAGGPLRVVASVPADARWIGQRKDEPERLFISEGPRLASRDIADGGKPRVHASVEGWSRPYSSGMEGSAGRWAAGSDLNVQRASLVVPSPDGNQLLAQVGPHVYLLTLAAGEGRALPSPGAVSVIAPQAAGVRVTRLTQVGGESPTWSADGRSIFYALGAAIFRHDAAPNGEFSATPTREIVADITFPVKSPRGRVAFTNARIVTMKGDEVLARGTVVVKDNRFEAVGAGIAIPSDAKVFDVAGCTLIPGLIDTHRHAPTGTQAGARPLQPWQSVNYLAFGVTTTHNPAQPLGDLDDGDVIAMGGAIGPRIFGTGPALEWWDGPFESYADVRSAIHRYADYWRTGRVKQYVAGDRGVRQWIAMAARERGLWLTIEGEDTNYNLAHVLDGYSDMAHTIGVVPLYADVLQLLTQAGTSVQYQFGTLRGEGAPSAAFYYLDEDDPLADEKARAFFPRERLQSRLMRRLHIHPREHAFTSMAGQAHALVQRGVAVGLGDHGEWLGLGMHWELQAAATAMSAHDALRMATQLGARSLGLEQDLGSIEPGKLADLLVLEADPLVDIRNSRRLRYVVKNGEVFRADDLFKVWPAEGAVPFVRWWAQDTAQLRPEASRTAR